MGSKKESSKRDLKKGPTGSTWRDLENNPVGFDVASDFAPVAKELVSGVREKDPYGPVMDKVGKRQNQNGRSPDPLLSAGVDEEDDEAPSS